MERDLPPSWGFPAPAYFVRMDGVLYGRRPRAARPSFSSDDTGSRFHPTPTP